MTAIPSRSLAFVESNPDAYIDAIWNAVQNGARTVRIAPASVDSVRLHDILRAKLPPEIEVVALAEIPAELTLRPTREETPTIYALFPQEGKHLPALLLQFLDWQGGWLIAPKTKRFYAESPLFLVSIPNAGAHLSCQLARRMGYRDGIELTGPAKPAHWYCLEYSNLHTSAPDFFIDSARRDPLGNRAHPFPRTPTLFIYRNPLDILVAEANSYNEGGKGTLHGYLSELSFDERLKRLLFDPWLLGSIRDRVGKFLAWLDFPNIVPLSYEELIGARGGGDDQVRESLIWSIQLKLQIPGHPGQIGEAILEEDSPTINKDSIGSYRKALTRRVFDEFSNLDQDFMELLGYAGCDMGHTPFPPARAGEFRRRSLKLSIVNHDETPFVQ